MTLRRIASLLFASSALAAGCTQRETLYSTKNFEHDETPTVAEAAESASSDAALETPVAVSTQANDAGAGDSSTVQQSASANGPDSGAPTSADGDAGGADEGAADDDAKDSGAKDYGAKDSGAADVDLCARACAAGADLPCASEQCVTYCLDDLGRDCAAPYRVYLRCLAERAGSEYSCDQDNDLIAPVACKPEEEGLIECWFSG